MTSISDQTEAGNLQAKEQELRIFYSAVAEDTIKEASFEATTSADRPSAQSSTTSSAGSTKDTAVCRGIHHNDCLFTG